MNKKRYTTYLSERHLKILTEIANETGQSISTLIGEALDDFLMEIERLDKPVFPPVDKAFYLPRSYDLNLNRKRRHHLAQREEEKKEEVSG
jgi:hypothetical protein